VAEVDDGDEPEAVSEEALAAADDVNAVKEVARNKPLTRPRPGHADLVGMQKYGHEDARPVLERASARETAARVALGEVAARFVEQAYGIRLVSHTVSIGTAGVPADAGCPLPTTSSVSTPTRCAPSTPRGRPAMVAEVDAAKKDGDTLGGVVEVLAYGLPPGLGSHVHWDRKLDGLLAQALMSIQAIKGVEVGDGFETARRRGSLAHDEMELVDGVITRRTGRAGGTEGGMSTGQVLRVRAAMKPISTVPRALATVDVSTGEAATAIHQRSDVCAVPAAGVVAEAMVALVLAQSCLEKFGGDSVTETSRNHAAYLDGIREGLRTW
jgi:chorismate synthase